MRKIKFDTCIMGTGKIAINWYKFLVDKGVKFMWETEVKDIDFENGEVILKD